VSYYNPVWKPVIFNEDMLAPNGNQVSVLTHLFLWFVRSFANHFLA
jgi:hypothetical protein